MLKLFFLLALTMVVFMQTMPAYCEGMTRSLVISATIPEHIMTINNNLSVSPLSNNTYQIVQTQGIIRDNKSILLTSIVVP